MGTIYIDTGGSATNSGSTNNSTASISGTAATASGTTVTLDALTDLSSVVTTPGSTQSSIYLSQASNSNKKIFWISNSTGSGGATPQITVDTAPTGITTSSWAIGGWCVLTPASQTGALRAGDVAQFNNSPASAAATLWTFRIAGDSTSGPAKIIGKSGTRPVLTVTNTANVISDGGFFNCWIENFQLVQQGASGSVINLTGIDPHVVNVKITQGGGNGITATGNGLQVIASEVTGCGGDGINYNAQHNLVLGNYIHANTGNGITDAATSPNGTVANNVIAANTGRGIYQSGAIAAASGNLVTIYGNTVYTNLNSGLEVADADADIVLINNIFMNNGNAGGRYNVLWVAGAAELVGYHGYNVFNTAAAGGSGNVSGLTINSTEISTNPLLNNPGSGDFTLQATSPALAIGYPGQLVGATGQGYLDLGAQQRQSGASGAAGYIIGG